MGISHRCTWNLPSSGRKWILGANTQQIILLPEEISDLGIEIAEEEIEIVEPERLVIAENTQTDEADVLVDESATEPK